MERIRRSEVELEEENDFFINDEPITGVLYEVYENGQLQYEKTIVNSILEGLFESWYSNGQLKSTGSYQKNKKEGTWSSYFSNAQLESSIEYLQGHIVKKEKLNECGNLIEKLETDFKNGGKTEKTKILRWNKQGRKIEEIIAEYGIVLSKKTWDNEGDLKDEYIFSDFNFSMLHL
jgi:antitoxin component YwqK of YwqJK toxin-antitoxin module